MLWSQGGGLTSDQFVDILSQRGNKKMSVLYEPGSVAEQMVNAAKAERDAEFGRRLIKEGMDDEKISKLTDLPINKVADLRKEAGEREVNCAKRGREF